MPQVLILAAMGAGFLFVRRWYAHERSRIAGELLRAREAMAQRDAESIVALERDPATGIYRPRQH